MLSNLGARLNLLSRFANSTSIQRRVIQKQYLCESYGSVFSRVTSAYFSTTGVCKDKSTKADNRRSLFMHRMQKKINHEDFEGALGVYRKLRSLRLDDHVGVFNKLFNLAIAQDDPTKIEQVLSEMNAANVLPISKTLEILFPYLIQKDMRVHVLKLADQMKKHHIPIREIEIQESLAEYLKRAPKEEELPKKEKSKKKAKETEEEEKPKKKPMTVISSEKQLKKEVEKYLQSNKDADGSLNKKKSSDKKSTKKSDRKSKEDEEDDDEDQHEKKITKKGNSINIKEKSLKTEVDKEGKTKKITKEKSETVIEDKKAKKDQKKHEDDKKSNKKQKVIEEDEFDDEEFDDDDFDDDEVIEKVEKKKTKKITKSGAKKVKKTVKKVKKVSTK